jgi:hypothetical protein
LEDSDNEFEWSIDERSDSDNDLPDENPIEELEGFPENETTFDQDHEEPHHSEDEQENEVESHHSEDEQELNELDPQSNPSERESDNELEPQ